MTNQSKNSRRGNNEGSIRERKDRGNWEAQISIGGKRVTKTFETRTAALKWIRDMQNQVEAGLTSDGSRLTIGEAIDKWLENGKDAWQPKTYSRYSEVVRLHIQPYIKPRQKVIDFRPEHVDIILNAAKEKKLGARTQQYILSTLHKLFAYLIARRIITNNPANAGFKIGYAPQKRPTWTRDQTHKFLRIAEGSWHEHLYYLALVTGMREGELLGLLWADVGLDEANGYISISHQLQWLDHPKEGEPRYIFKTPKTEKSKRLIPIGPETVKRLKQQQQKVTMQKIINADKWQEHDLVFPNLVGNPIDPNNMIKDFRKLTEKAGLPKIRFHDIRHTCASLLLLANVHPKIVSERLGHQDIRITLQTYSHVIPSMQGEATQIIEGLVAGQSGLTPVTPPMPAERPSSKVFDL